MSFDIPFDKDATAAPLSSTRGMIRSVSTDDGSGFKVQHLPRGMKRNLSFQPVNGTKVVGIAEEGCPDGLAGAEPEPAYPNGHGGLAVAAPSVEEALQIIHSPTRPAAEGIQNGFFLHSQEHGAAGLEPVSEWDSKGDSDTAEMDTGIHVRTEDMLDEDSSLKDCSVNTDLDLDSPSPCASSLSKSPSGLRMTSFAEQKLKKHTPDSGRCSSSSLKTTPEGSEPGAPLSVSWAPTPEHSPVRQHAAPAPQAQPLPSGDPAQAMATEMVQLRMRLEEKRKAIEAQKKKVEAAFTRHRQKMGHSAFLNVVKRKGDGAASGEEGGKPEGEGKAASPVFKFGRGKADTPDGAEQSGTGCWAKSPGVGEESGGQGPAQLTELDLTEYTRSIEKLNHSLAFLQGEMQRLSQQQDVIMAMRQQREQQAWVIPAAHANPSPQRHGGGRAGAAAARSSGPSSPADSPLPSRRSPTNIKRKSASFHSRNPRAARPSELKLAPYNRVLTAPQSVDSIPRLRRFSPCQPLACSFAYMEENPAPRPAPAATDTDKTSDSPLPPEREGVSPPAPSSPSRVPRDPAQENEAFKDLKPAPESSFPEVLSHPVTETFTVAPTEAPPRPEAPGQARGGLIEVPLSGVKPPEGGTREDGAEAQQDDAEGSDCDQMMRRGFFFKVGLKRGGARGGSTRWLTP